jgi:hypothetical protein
MISREFTAVLKRGGSCCGMLELCDAGAQPIGPAVRERSWMRRSGLLASMREWSRVNAVMMSVAVNACHCCGFCVPMRFP